MCERHVGNRRVHALRGHERGGERRGRRVDPLFLVKALHHLQRRRQPPIELSEHLVLLVPARKRRIRTRLTVVVAQILIRAEEPQPLALDGTADAGREIAKCDALVSAGRLGARRHRTHDRLRRQAGRLSVIRGLACEPIASLLRDDVEDASLHVAELDRRADRLHVKLLNHVHDRLGARHALARTCEIRSVDEKRILVDGRSEHGHGVDGAARR